MHRRRKVDEKSCMTFLLYDLGWYINRYRDSNSRTNVRGGYEVDNWAIVRVRGV